MSLSIYQENANHFNQLFAFSAIFMSGIIKCKSLESGSVEILSFATHEQLAAKPDVVLELC